MHGNQGNYRDHKKRSQATQKLRRSQNSQKNTEITSITGSEFDFVETQEQPKLCEILVVKILRIIVVSNHCKKK